MPGVIVILLSFVSAASAAPDALWPDAFWIDVPYVHQEENGCGSASVAMVISYWQARGALSAITPPDPAAIQRELYVPTQKGIPAESLRAYLEHDGFTAIAFSGEWEDLAQ